MELLAKAARIAEETSGHLGEAEIDAAERTLEVDKSVELIRALATQQRYALQACYHSLRLGAKRVSTGEAMIFINVSAYPKTAGLSPNGGFAI